VAVAFGLGKGGPMGMNGPGGQKAAIVGPNGVKPPPVVLAPGPKPGNTFYSPSLTSLQKMGATKR